MGELARRRPGPAPSLTRAQVVEAALAVMAEDGLNAVSFRSVASRLAVNPMALYTYVRDKDELLAGMFDKVSGEITLTRDSRAPVVDQLVAYYVSARRVLLHNAELYRLVRRADLPGMDFRTAEQLCELLARLGLEPAQVAAVQAMLLQYTIGNALYSRSAGTEGLYATVITAVRELDTADYPHLRATYESSAAVDPEKAFVTGLRLIVEAFTPPRKSES